MKIDRFGVVRVVACLGLAAALPQLAFGYAFGVSPIRVGLSPTSHTVGVTVSNDEDIELSFQARLMRWSQNEKGEDKYEESKDLVYFPRVLSVAPKDQRVIRVGNKGAPAAVEGTYRLFIDEVTPAPKEKGKAPSINVRMQFALPVFVDPVKPEPKPLIENLAIEPDKLSFDLHNAGNQHVKVEKISLRRDKQVLKEGTGWYVLAGARRRFALPLPPGACEKPGALQLVLEGEGVELTRAIAAEAGHCRP